MVFQYLTIDLGNRGAEIKLNPSKIRHVQVLRLTSVWFLALVLMLSPLYAKGESRAKLPFYECFEQVARDFSLDPGWLTAISIVESSLNPKAVSSSNAIGLMQIKWPITAKHLGAESKESLFSPCLNIRLGGKYLRELLDKYDEDRTLAASAYRIGPTALSRSKEKPQVVIDYLQKIDSQLEIFATKRTPVASVEPIKAKPVISQLETYVKSSAPKNLENIVSVPSPDSSEDIKNTTPIPSRLCDIQRLQVATLSTHNPAEREKSFFSWLKRNAPYCETKDLILIQNQVAIWLGAGDTRRIRDMIMARLESKT